MTSNKEVPATFDPLNEHLITALQEGRPSEVLYERLSQSTVALQRPF